MVGPLSSTARMMGSAFQQIAPAKISSRFSLSAVWPKPCEQRTCRLFSSTASQKSRDFSSTHPWTPFRFSRQFIMKKPWQGFQFFSTLSENPKSQIQPNQPLIRGDLLELHVFPKVLSDKELKIVRNWIDCTEDLAYDDFDARKGIIWDNYRVSASRKGQFPQLLSIDPVKKFVIIAGVNVEQFPQSIFNYPKISKILLKKILPIYLEAISKQNKLPTKLYMQTFVLRSLLSETHSHQKQHVRWHQDPSDYGNSVADYTMVLMLSDSSDYSSGWKGGELLVKNGMPTDETPAIHLTPKLNQAILFNNKVNSHAVTAITKARNHTTRDIVIINAYLKDPSQ